MNILYCGDKNIEDGLIISVLSLIENTDEPLNIFVLTMALETEEKTFRPLPQSLVDFLGERIKQGNPYNTIKLIDAGKIFENFMPSANLNTRFTPFCMLRLYADKIEGLPDKILYLDNDVVCRKDFSEFYHSDISNAELSGVLDYYGRWFFRNNPFKLDYLNSGVLLLNLKKIRETGLFEMCRERCRKSKMFMPDQSAINKLSTAKIIAERKYNEQRKLCDETVFQHFTTSFRFFPIIRTVAVKPWNIEKMHSVLGIYEYDELINEYLSLKADYQKGETQYEL